jgi:hypothetical protein
MNADDERIIAIQKMHDQPMTVEFVLPVVPYGGLVGE